MNAIFFVISSFVTKKRSVILSNTHDETVTDLYDIKLKRFRLRDQDLLNSTSNLDNEQFFMFGPDGLMNFTTVVGFPMFVSKVCQSSICE
jgi:hypothetical protein